MAAGNMPPARANDFKGTLRRLVDRLLRAAHAGVGLSSGSASSRTIADRRRAQDPGPRDRHRVHRLPHRASSPTAPPRPRSSPSCAPTATTSSPRLIGVGRPAARRRHRLHEPRLGAGRCAGALRRRVGAAWFQGGSRRSSCSAPSPTCATTSRPRSTGSRCRTSTRTSAARCCRARPTTSTTSRSRSSRR